MNQKAGIFSNLFESVFVKYNAQRIGVKVLVKTKKIMVGITSTALMFGLAGCNQNDDEWETQQSGTSVSQDIPPAPQDQECSEWDWDDDDGVWECDEGSSRYYGHYYYGGHYYGSRSALFNSSAYKSYKKGSSFKGSSSSTTTKSGSRSTSSGKSSSGFGSGSKSFGG